MDYQLIISVVVFFGGLITHSESLLRSANVTADTLVFSTVLTVPYLMEVDDEVDENGDIMYEGFIIDLWEKLNEAMDHKYDKARFIPVKDGKYGSPNGDGTWNGMIGEVIRGEADGAFAPLAITKARSKVVDLTKPYLNDAISVLIKKELMITTLDELLNNTQVSYGCVSGGRTHMLFQESKNKMIMQMNATMASQDPSVFVTINEAGAAKAIQEDYAFIGETATLKYLAAHHCGMTTFPIKLFPVTGYGIAFEKKSRFKSDFNAAILSLLTDGEIQMLQNKWWSKKAACDFNSTEYQTLKAGEENYDGVDDDDDENNNVYNGCTDKRLSVFCIFSLTVATVLSIIFM